MAIKKKARTTSRPWWRQKRTLLIAGASVILVVASLVGYHFYAWNQYASANDDRYSAARNEAQEQLAAEDISIDTISAIESQLSRAAEQQCDNEPLFIKWRTQIDTSAQELVDECQQRKAALVQASEAATLLHKRLQSEQEMAEVLSATTKQLKEVKEGEYAKAQSIWQDTQENVAALGMGSENDEVQSVQVAVNTIIKRYDGVLKADKAQKRPAFDDASVELRKAYEQLEAIAKTSRADYRPLAERLVVSIENL